MEMLSLGVVYSPWKREVNYLKLSKLRLENITPAKTKTRFSVSKIEVKELHGIGSQWLISKFIGR